MSQRSLRLLVPVALACLVATLTGGPVRAASEPVVVVPAGSGLVLTGHGYGHGRGMSQYGAEGAARKGLSAAQILAFYYPGTVLGASAGQIRVRITADTDDDTVVAHRPGLVVRTVGKPAQRWDLGRLRSGAASWRIKPLRNGRYAVSARAAGARWARVLVSGRPLAFWAGGAPITLQYAGGSAAYRGQLRNAGRDTVNVLSLENYLRGVVPREVPSGWSPATLQAQAVAARTYAAYERDHTPRGRAWQTCDTTSCQVYGGYAAERPSTNAAVDATRGQVVTHGGRAAFTQFSSSNGGWTVQGGLPYQRAQADPYDPWPGNPMRSWTTRVSASRIAAAWPSIGTLTGVQVLGRDGNGEWGGRVLTLRLTGTAGRAVDVDGSTFRTKLGLRSQWFSVAAG
ncbi:MAG TPA: SpoIID/LytB domain-containing protein [Nocardioides sp.]|uniref:SpoIID/LytB domain-containing protein n=1 Tax=Nocardioides sp. TaxID=35761 RepID=UPI002ED7A7D2